MDPPDRPPRDNSMPPSQASSFAPSPADTRSASGYAPIAGTRDDERYSESYNSTDTVRRRPDPATYGTISPSITASSSQNNEQSASHERPSYDRHHSRAATGGSQPSRSPMIGSGAERGRVRPRKPPMPRRASSNVQAPHRGGIFSVDDAPEELAADQGLDRQTSYSTTVRRRPTAAPPALSRIQSSRDAVEGSDDVPPRTPGIREEEEEEEPPSLEVPEQQDEIETEDPIDEETPEDDDDDDDLSDAESFTLRDRQQAINETHPFGIRLWKPALYKKDRSVQKTAEGDIHSSPGGRVNSWLLLFNILWTICFGWWLCAIAYAGALVCFIFAAVPSGREYGRVLWGLGGYVFYPFGKFIRLEQQDPYIDEDEGEGRSITEYEQWQNGDLEYGRLFFGPDRGRSIIGRSRRSIDSGPSETDSLLGRGRGSHDTDSDADVPRVKRRLFGRGQWNIGRVIFFLFFYMLITPSLFFVSGICWLLVFWIPMGKVTILLFDHLRRHPLAMSFESDISYARTPGHSSVVVCTYRAVGLKYWKYTVDGTNIFLINLMAVVLFVILDWLILDGILHLDIFITSPAFLFVAGLLSIIPLAYFIGQAVASISAQSSMGLGAAINAFFSTIVEVFLYCVALKDGKGALVEGSIVGSIFAGILFLPGLSMCFGAIKRKTQRFNARSAGVTSTMLLFAVIGAFGPTLFYQIYGSHELTCVDCISYGEPPRGEASDCRRCYFSQTPALDERFYIEAVRPYCYMAAVLLFLSYAIGLWFTLRTHAAVIWNVEQDEKRHEEQQQQMRGAAGRSAPRSGYPSLAEASGADIRDSAVYKRTLGQTLRQVGLQPSGPANGNVATPHIPPPKNDSIAPAVNIPGLSDVQNNELVQHIAEIATTAATAAARDARSGHAKGTAPNTPHIPQGHANTGATSLHRPPHIRTATFPDLEDPVGTLQAEAAGHGGHDAPNWSRLKSAVILMGATVLYAIIAEILVDTVDVVLEGFAIDEKFLGITLFALVPNTTEFLNAISFAMNGNIALSMEIGSAYALQVCLLQIPALVLFSAVYPMAPTDPFEAARYTFTLLFPQWDMVTVILCVFLLSYMYGEGKSNYFKGSILLLSYLVVITGYYFSGYTFSDDSASAHGAGRFDTWNAEAGAWVAPAASVASTVKTVGRTVVG